MEKKYILLILIIIMGLSSCNDYLTTTPTDFLNPGNYFQNETQLVTAKSSVYNALQSTNVTSFRPWYLYAWDADLLYQRSSLRNGPWDYNLDASETTFNGGLWSSLWVGVDRANQVLANLDRNPDIPQATRDVIRGEMLFIRGYFYFMLVETYGGVPLKLEPTADINNVDIARNTVTEVYAQILQDMEAAEKLVLDINTVSSPGTVNKSGVRGILAKVNLYMAGEPLNDKTRYAEAKKWAKMVMDDATHALNPSYPQIFINLAQDKYDKKESIWEVEFAGNNMDQYSEAGLIGYINGPYYNGNLNTGRAEAYMAITSKLYDLYEPGDNRKWWNISFFQYDKTGPSGAKTLGIYPGGQMLPTNDGLKNLMLPGKFRREYELVLPKGNPYTPENAPMLRYADVLLMFAEADNEVSGHPTPEAIAAVNLVRERAWSTGIKQFTVTNGGSGYTTAPTVTITGGGGTGGATATATVSNGVVTGIELNRDMTGIQFYVDGDYSSAPVVSISGGGGTGATATATIWHKTDADLTSAQTATHDSFFASIQDERARELVGENSRKFDLIRWGKFIKTYQDMTNLANQQNPGHRMVEDYKYVTSSKSLLMPIPITEMQTNQAMEQNPGY